MCAEQHPIKFFSRCQRAGPRLPHRGFKLDCSSQRAEAIGGGQRDGDPPRETQRKGVALHLFHPVLPFVLTVFQVNPAPCTVRSLACSNLIPRHAIQAVGKPPSLSINMWPIE